MFAEDIKLFCIVNNQVEADLLQSNINMLYEWCIWTFTFCTG